ncbi:DUF4123 domain-containing protein [Zooshikella harenae]|uniref:DUF4123 domain-containing protein n=1 Tax=Zooshikella harenae TaxID=2827238 RepID=A0ABS5ZJ72_9GAMM|nr:DUF4123 domain-containing protein [Zooshikella harenae]MBU2713995.1 DUF4123 domain-containing protein [Zooshikella harenae]
MNVIIADYKNQTMDHLDKFINNRKAQLFMLIDGVYSFDDHTTLQKMYELQENVKCYLLYLDTKLSNYIDISPLLVQVDDVECITDFIKDFDMEESTIFLTSHHDCDSLGEHLSNFIEVDLYGEVVFFRFYDPLIMFSIVNCKNESLKEKLFLGINQVFFIYDNSQKAILFAEDKNQSNVSIRDTLGDIIISDDLYERLVFDKEEREKHKAEDYVSVNYPNINTMEVVRKSFDLCKQYKLMNSVSLEFFCDVIVNDEKFLSVSEVKMLLGDFKLEVNVKNEKLEEFYALYKVGLLNDINYK